MQLFLLTLDKEPKTVYILCYETEVELNISLFSSFILWWSCAKDKPKHCVISIT